MALGRIIELGIGNFRIVLMEAQRRTFFLGDLLLWLLLLFFLALGLTTCGLLAAARWRLLRTATRRARPRLDLDVGRPPLCSPAFRCLAGTRLLGKSAVVPLDFALVKIVEPFIDRATVSDIPRASS